MSGALRRLTHTKSAFPDVYIVGAARTAIGSFHGQFSKTPAVALGVAAFESALSKSGLKPSQVEDVYFGQVLQAGVGQSPARQVALGAGCPVTTEATTVNKVCASGMKTIMLATQNIQTGHRGIMVAGGMENMSLTPNYYPRTPATFGNVTVADGIVRDGLQDAYDDIAMGVCADRTAKTNSISREDQDTYALTSYARAAAAWEAKRFDEEIAPVTIKDKKKGDKVIVEDEDYRKIIPSKIGSLRPVFAKDGTVTAANASTLNDGASAVVLASQERVDALGLKPLARIISFADAAVAPQDFGIAPAQAIPAALLKAGLKISDIAKFEINEAFSAVAIVNTKLMGLEADKLNVLGGAVALGHPLGSSGCRIVVTLLHLLKSGEYGVAAICNGGGGASAIVIQRV